MLRKRFVLSLAWFVASLSAASAAGQTINLSLNLQYTNVLNPALGGVWDLVAKTSATNGIAGIDAVLTNVNAGGITYQAGINATTIGGNAMVISGPSFVQIIYGQDSSTPANVALNVGRGVGTPGNIPLDFINDATWNNAARIMTGTFAAATPAFTTNNDTPADVTAGNVWSTASAPFTFSTASSISTTVRNNLNSVLGDYNHNGVVDIADYPLWRDTLNKAGLGLAADGSGNGVIDQADYGVWRNRFGANSGSGSASGESTAVPEPDTLIMALSSFALVVLLNVRRQIRLRSLLIAPARLFAVATNSPGDFHRMLLFLTALVASAIVGNVASAQLINSEWNTGNGNWNVPGNWFPNASAPDNGAPLVTNTYNVQIGNRPVAASAQVTFLPVSGTSDTISSLTVSNNADLFTNGRQLNILAATIVDGVGTTIRVDPHATPGTAALTSLDLNLNNGGGLTMAGGIAEVTRELEINAGSVLGGHGTVNVGDGDGVVEQAFENSALLQVQGNTAAPQTLTIHANGVDTIDLDGTTNAGVVDVDNAVANVNADTVTLIIDGPLTEAFGGVVGASIQIGQRDTLTFNDNFTIAGPAAITMNGGNAVATLNGPGNITSITGATFTITNAALIQNDMTFSGTANVITVNANSSLELGGTVAIPDASALVFSASTSQLIVSSDASVTELAGDFNWDGPGSATTTVEGAGTFTVNVNRVDTTDDIYGGTLNLNDNADISVNNTANLWTMAGAINKNNAGSSTVAGDTVIVTGAITVNAGSLTMPVTMLNPSATIVANGTLVLGGGSSFAGPSSVTGSGTLRMASTSNVTANTTIGVTTFDWDGTSAGSLHTINAGVIFTINSTIFDSDGDMDDPISLAGNGGQLNVNGVTNWTMAEALTTNPAAVGTATIGGTARMTLAGAGASWAVSGNTTANAPVTFGSSATTIAAARTLRLAGGDNNLNTNVMAGGTIGGAGTLAANDARELRGFGNIGATIDFDDTARLRADNGTLTIGGTILDVGVIGTADSDGVLNVTNAWNNNVAAGVALLGGTVQGGTITNDTAQGIQGFGTVTSRVINNTQLLSFNGGTLIFQTAGNDNDWDGATGDGLLRAFPGTTLELRGIGPAFQFGGTVQADAGGRVFVNDPINPMVGVAFDFLAGSDLILNSGTYEATASTDLEGTTTVAVGADSTIKVRNDTFLTFRPGSTTTLNGNLRLENNNIIVKAGAMFSGAGALIVQDGSHMVADHAADIDVLLNMQGALRPGNSEGIGRVELFDYQQEDSGELFVEVTGTLLNAFDRLVASGDVVVDGYLNVDIDLGFVPQLGQTFNIITGNSVTGEFDYADVSGMPGGRTFQINYLNNAVQLKVVNTPFFSADFDDDGDVDKTDLSIWKGAFNLNQLGDADGDNDSDGADFLLWQRQFGSKPGMGAGSGFATSVPEPSSLALVLFALLAFGARTIRRSNARLYLVS